MLPGWSQLVRPKTPQRGVWCKATFPAGTPALKERDMACNFFDDRKGYLQKAVQLWPWASTRVLNAFHYMEIKTDQDINDAWFKGRFRNIPNLGKKSIKEIQVAMGLPDAGRKKCPHCGALV
jgi:hypothetical protein